MSNLYKERPIKKIIVSIWYKGKLRWALVDARKVGKHYQISAEAFDKLLENIPNGATISAS